jgi:hypothetical protein
MFVIGFARLARRSAEYSFGGSFQERFLDHIALITSMEATGAPRCGCTEDIPMKKCLLLIVGFVLSTIAVSSQGKPVIVVQAFTTAAGVQLPYDLKLMQPQLVAEFKVILGKEFDIAAEAPTTSTGTIYTLDGEITGWRPGNAAKRIIVGLGSGREASDIHYRVTDASGKQVLERKDTVRTNFFSQGAGSTGTLAHPIAQKIAERIKEAKLK